MRLRSLHVDGFGALADFDCAQLAPGLVVFLGPNEAGKSTLRDFVCGMLFGFPNRRNDPHFRAPVRGGRHGGTLAFVDDAGGHWSVERYLAPQRSVLVRLPDGRDGDDDDLRQALGHASAGLFRTVFAIGLDELGRIDTTSTDEARELLFASSLFGERRSATRAIRQLADACAELARPRQGDARANRLVRELDEVRAALQAARTETAGYEARRREVARLEQEMQARREQIRSCRRRERELEAFIRCWPISCRAEVAEQELATLPPPDPAVGRLREVAAEVKDLYAEVSGHQERMGTLEMRRSQRSGVRASVTAGLGQLGEDWTEERVRSSVAPDVLAEHVRETRRNIVDHDGAVAAARAVLEDAEATVDDLRRQRGQWVAASAPAGAGGRGGDSIPSAAHLRERRRAVSELRERLAEIDELSAALATEQNAVARSQPAVPGWMAAAATIGVLVLGATALALVARHQPVPAAACAGVAVLLAAIGSGLAIARRRARAAGSEAGGGLRARTGGGEPRRGPDGRGDAGSGTAAALEDALAREVPVKLERARSRASELAGTLGLPLPPSRVDVTRLDVRLTDEAEQRAALDRLEAALGEAERRRDEAERAWTEGRRNRERLDERFAEWKRQHGFAGSLDPDGALEAVAQLNQVRELLEALERIGQGIGGLEVEVTSFSQRCTAVAGRLGLDEEAPAPDRLRDWLESLLGRFEELSAVEGRRLALTGEISAAESDLERALGSGPDGDRLLGELASGEIWRWQQELEELAPTLESLASADEHDVRAHQSATEALAELARSDRIATLEQRLAALEEQLDATLRQYLVIGTARQLLQETLTRHERERQPAVIAAAAQHFSRVTSRRYTGLVADAGPEAIRVLAPSGSSVDAGSLSRGTIEQLYLCLRLGLATSFAERGVALPLVLDDVLVNFDAGRAQAVATELAATAEQHQVLFMTCHRHLADLMLASATSAPAQLVELERL